MERRVLLAGLGTLASTLVAGCTAFRSSTSSPSHRIRILNQRQTSHDILVELKIDGEEREYGPETVEAGNDWSVATIESLGSLTVRATVDEELVWEDTHDVPTTETGASRVIVQLSSGGDVDGFVEVDD